MRLLSRNCRLLMGNRPFQGALGASLYVGTPGGPAIRYRRNLIMSGGADVLAPTQQTINFGASSIPKSQRVATVASPTDSMTYAIPAALLGVNVACQVRTYEGDYENETIYRPVIIGVGGVGTPNDTILGTAVVLTIDKLDAGGMLVTFAYTADANGLQPTQFALVKTSGSGTVADVVITAGGDRVNQIEVDGLTDGMTYGFNLQARNGAVTVVLASLSFTADATGPADPTSVVATPY